MKYYKQTYTLLQLICFLKIIVIYQTSNQRITRPSYCLQVNILEEKKICKSSNILNFNFVVCAQSCQYINVWQSSGLEGGCGKLLERWIYKEKHNKCFLLLYIGCKGYGNNFDTEEECLSTCSSGATNFFPSNSYSLSSGLF